MTPVSSTRNMVRDLLFVGPLMLLHIFLGDIVRSEKAHVGSEKACSFVQCDLGENCVSRKFWCKNPPCPSMLYCSKTPRESMKGPMTCDSVRCSKGYICMVKVRRCRWDHGCKQQIARCVSEREYYEGPASCADFHCASGHRCILRESLCAHPPCKLLKSCANAKDVQAWHGRCITLGCPSEYECFLRRPSDNCVSANSCKHTPDCTVTNVEDVPVNPECRGWVCPRDQQCSAMSSEFCSSEDGVEGCRVNRTCHGPLATFDTVSSPATRLVPRSNQHPGHRTDQTTASIEAGHTLTPSHTDCSPNTRTVHVNWEVQFEKWNSRNGSFYRAPVYVRSTFNSSGGDAEKTQSKEQPTDRSTTQWLDHLRLKTGVNAIDVWIKQAEENRKYGQFNEWLAAVRSNLGPFRFENWLRELQKLTSEYPAFQKWLIESHSGNENGAEEKTSAVFPDQEETPELDSKRTQEATESPDHGYRTLKDFSGNDRSLFSVIQETPNEPLRKNAGHPRINYGRNRSYKQHRELHPPETKNQLLTESKIHDPSSRLQSQREDTHKTDTKIGYFDSPELQKKVTNNQAQANHSLQLDGHGQLNASIRNDLTLDSVAKLQKSMWNGTRVQENSQENDIRNKNSLSNVAVRKEEEPHDLITGEKYDQVRSGSGNLSSESRDQIGHHNGLDYNLLLFTKVEDPRWDSGPEGTPVSTVTRPFTGEDQREPSQGLESPVSAHRQYYQRIYELDHRVPEGLTKSRNSSSDIGTRKDEDLTKTYIVSDLAPEELHIISPWEAVRVLDPKKRGYYSLLGFSPEQDNDRLRVRYPVVVSRTSSVDRAHDFPQHAKDIVDISLGSKSSTDLNSWNQLFQYQQIPRQTALPISEIDLEERKQGDYLTSQPKHRGQTARSSFEVEKPLPISAPIVNWYFWDGRARHQLPEVSQVQDLPVRSQSTGFVDLKERSKEYGSAMSSQEHLDAYVNALIEDALSRVILSEQLGEGGGPGDWKSSGNPGDFFQNIRSPLDNGFKKEHLDIIQERQFPEEKIFRDEKDHGDSSISDIPETVQSTKDVLIIETQTTTTPDQDPSTDLTIGEMRHRYQCQDGDRGSSGPSDNEEESSTLDEVEEYYDEDTEQEYYAESLEYQDEYLGDLERNVTDYDFQYYEDEDYDKVLSQKVN